MSRLFDWTVLVLALFVLAFMVIDLPRPWGHLRPPASRNVHTTSETHEHSH
jgi:hypothetical protein